MALPPEHPVLLNDLRHLIDSAHQRTAAAVNAELTLASGQADQ
ncbi:hypothetical protein [Vreelandella zhuhanensis]|nr:hypothetical protein [Halomonas zhuhanensis]